MFRRLWFLLTSYDDRIPRSQFWLGMILVLPVTFVFGIFGVVLDLRFHTSQIAQLSMLAGLYPFTTILEYVASIFFGGAVAVKRLHDRNKRARWLLLQVIPIVGTLWLVFEMGFLKGSAGENDWGDDPLNRRREASAAG